MRMRSDQQTDLQPKNQDARCAQSKGGSAKFSAL